MSLVKRLTYLLLFILASLPLSAQKTERTDSLVRLMSAQSAQLIEKDGISYRKIMGPARFLHNDTYLVCDSSLWNVNTNVIQAMGNVKIIQEETILSGDNLDYYVDEDLAQFRGYLVQLEDKDHNILRTRFLDYNTKDSVAIFQHGASMKDKDGQIIESINGTYDSKINLFTFTDNVNMFSDSMFVKTNRLTYNTDSGLATFSAATDAWNQDKMISAGGGWYDRANEVFFFRNNVHMMSEAQEGWSDSLYYYRNVNNVDLLGHVQLVDTTRNVAALGGRVFYQDSISTVTLTREAAVMLIQENESKLDTTWVGADTLKYRQIMMCDVDSLAKVDAKVRLEEINSDPVSDYRKQAAEAAAKRREEALKNDPNNPAYRDRIQTVTASTKTDDDPEPEPDDQLDDTLDMDPAPPDSLSGFDPLDIGDMMLEPEKDTTKVGFLNAFGRVKIFRSDMQVACDSLVYNDLDSLARFYKDPVVWNDGNRQYSADSIAVSISNQNLDKARLMSNAFIAVLEEASLYDQIRATEMMAYFDTTGALRRFDALGGVNALFYLKENEKFATANQVDAKMMSAQFVDGEINRVHLYDNGKNNGFPVVQLPQADRELKGFRWLIEQRPSGKEDITPLEFRKTERSRYESRPRPDFSQTNQYFPGYIDDVQKQIAKGDSVRRAQAAQPKEDIVEEPQPRIDDAPVVVVPSEDIIADEPVVNLSREVIVAKSDSLIVKEEKIAVPVDTISVEPVTLDPKDLKKQQKEQDRKIKEDKREQKWADLDAKDAEKTAKKEAKALKRKRAQTLKKLKKMDKTTERDDATRLKYQKRYEKKKARKDGTRKAYTEFSVDESLIDDSFESEYKEALESLNKSDLSEAEKAEAIQQMRTTYELDHRNRSVKSDKSR